MCQSDRLDVERLAQETSAYARVVLAELVRGEVAETVALAVQGAILKAEGTV